MNIKFKNGSKIETISSEKCIRGKRLTDKKSANMHYLEYLACEIFLDEQLKSTYENIKPLF